MIKYVPNNLDIDALLQAYPPNEKLDPERLIHIVSLITEIPARKKGMLNETDFIPINAKALKKNVYDYKKYIDYLVVSGVLECSRQYIVGKKSRGYRFTEQYRTTIRPVEIKKHTLIKSLKYSSLYSRNLQVKYAYLNQWLDGRLQIDYDNAVKFLQYKYERDRLTGVKNPLSRFNADLLNVIAIRECDFRFSVDSTAQRIHTNLTRMRKELRNFLTFRGGLLSSVDIKCSQPTLTLLLLSEEFYTGRKNKDGLITIKDLSPSISKHIPVNQILSILAESKSEIEQYKAVVEEDIYNKMIQAVKENTGTEITSRKEAKKMFYSILYSDNRFIGQKDAAPKRIFKKSWPNVYEVFRLIKETDSARLSVMLQTIEAKIMLDRIAKRISREHPAMPLFTVHDSIVFPQGSEQKVAEVIQDEFLKATGIHAQIETELWSPGHENLQDYNTVAAEVKAAA